MGGKLILIYYKRYITIEPGLFHYNVNKRKGEEGGRGGRFQMRGKRKGLKDKRKVYTV